MKVVVTGGAGFIGANLGRELLARPDVDEVVALDDLSTGFRSNLDGTGVRLVEGSILDRDALDHACAGAASITFTSDFLPASAGITWPKSFAGRSR